MAEFWRSKNHLPSSRSQFCLNQSNKSAVDGCGDANLEGRRQGGGFKKGEKRERESPVERLQLLSEPADPYCLPASVHSGRIVSLALLLLLLYVPIRRRASPPPQNRLWCKQLQVKGDSFPS